MLVVTRKRPVLELKWHHCVQEKNLEGQAWETPRGFPPPKLGIHWSLKQDQFLLCLWCYFLMPWCIIFPTQMELVFRVPQPITCLTFLIPVPRVMLGLRVLGMKGLVWLRQKRNPINEVINAIQDIVSTQLKRTSRATCCTMETKPQKETPLNHSFLDFQGRFVPSTVTALRPWHCYCHKTCYFPLSSILPFVTSDSLAKPPAPLQKPLNWHGQSK